MYRLRCSVPALYGAIYFMRWKAIRVALVMTAPMIPAILCAQSSPFFTIKVQDANGAALPGAKIADLSGKLLGSTNADGSVAVDCASPCRLQVSAPGFSPQTLSLSTSATIHLQPATRAEEVVVTAYRAPLGALESPVSTRLLSKQALSNSAAVTLDEKMRELPGVELFRRSSSLVANPTSAGISLRGLGSTQLVNTGSEDDAP